MSTVTSKRYLHHFWMLGLAVLILFALNACVAVQPKTETTTEPELSASSALPEITITARDFAFDLPAEIPSGWVSLTLKNEGQVNHHGIVMRLLEGVTVEDALAAMDNPQADQSETSDLQFFMPDTDPGSSNQATVEFAPGHWVILSVSMDGQSIGASEEPVPDYALGSIQEFDVVDQSAMASPPYADLSLTVSKDAVDFPDQVEPGQHTIEVVNDSGQENGYAFILRMEGDTTIDDVLAMFDALFSGQEMDMSSMPVFHAVGGLMAYNLSDHYYTNVDMQPGNYTIITSNGANEFPYSGETKDFVVFGDEASSSSSQNATIPELLIQVNDDGIIAPEIAPGGIVHILVRNDGEQAHGLELWRIKQGHTSEEMVTMAQHLKAHPNDFLGIFDIGSWVQYLDYIEPGASADFYADLRTGEFMLRDDSLADADLIFFSAPKVVGVTEPPATVSVDMTDFAFSMPDAIKSGEQLWEVTNSGTQWHLAAIVNDNPDVSTEELLAAFDDSNGPPPSDAPVTIYGGVPPMSPGERVWRSISLEPGTYDLVCPLPDVNSPMNSDGPPMTHLEEGMRQMFNVENPSL